MFKAGARWLRADFHLHTEKDKEFNYSGDNFYDEYVDKLDKEDIKVGIITNHNKFNKHEFKNLKKRAWQKGIFLIPGVELTVKEGRNGIHTLIAFKEEDWLANGNDDINNFLNQIFTGIDNRENRNTRCNLDLISTIKKLDEFNKDYFIIFAHIEQDSGFIKELGGGLIQSLVSTLEFQERVYGFQKLRTIDNIEKLKGWLGYELAFVEGSDPKCIDDIGRGDHCYIKLGTFTFDAVKLALRDHSSKISKEPKKANHSYIKSISFIGGKFDGQVIYLSHELNTLIGIRGSGKSSILEVLRYGLNLDAGEDKKYKVGLVENTLGSGGKLILDVIDKHGRSYKIERILNETPNIIDDTGKDVNISINTIITNPLYFGQKDLSQTEDGYEINLLDKLLGDSLDDVRERISIKEEELIREIDNWVNLDDIDFKIKDLEDKNSDLKYKMEMFEKMGVADKFNKQVTFSKDKVQIEKVKTDLNNVYESLIGQVNEGLIEDLEKLKSYSTEYNEEVFDILGQYINEYIFLLETIKGELKKAEEIIQRIISLEEQLNKEAESLREEFAKIKREIDVPNLSADDYVSYSTLIQTNNNQILELKKRQSKKGKCESNIKKHIRERNELLLEELNIYKNEIDRINNNQDNLVIDIVLKGNKDEFKNLLGIKFQGTGITENKYQKISERFSDFVAIFEDVYFNNGSKLKQIITDREYNAVLDKFEQDMSGIIKTRVPNKININYHNKPLSQHSLGQRASALVLFILTQEDNDLIIIDQPEDDLDNKVIYKELITSIKDKKPKVQFIFATHNANIPVLGDAEQIIATSYSDEKIDIECGSIDVPEMQTKVVDIMEGGPEAFEKRNNIYKLWKIEN